MKVTNLAQRALSRYERRPDATSPNPARDRAIATALNGPGGESAPSAEAPMAAEAPLPAANISDSLGSINSAAISEVQKDPIEASDSSVEVKPEESKSEEPLSSQYAVLARKEKAIRQREQQIKAREAAMEAAEKPKAAVEAPSIDANKYIDREKLMNDPFGVLTDMGLTYDQLTEAAMRGPSSENLAVTRELKALRDELKALKGESENTKKSFEEQQEKVYKQGLNQIKSQVESLVSKDANYETIKETGSSSDVVELIEKTLQEDGILLTVEDAAQKVEDYLVDIKVAELEKLTKIKKIQQRLLPKSESKAEVKPSGAQQQSIKTLTNAMGSSRKMTSRERAIALMEGKKVD